MAPVIGPILQGPRGQAQLTEAHIALVEPPDAVRLVVDVVRHVFQVLQVRPLERTTETERKIQSLVIIMLLCLILLLLFSCHQSHGLCGTLVDGLKFILTIAVVCLTFSDSYGSHK